VRSPKRYFVYILASRTRRLYVGCTSDLTQRVWQHQTKAADGFTARYNIDRLVWFEETDLAFAAVTRERQIKAWRREKKVALIEAENPGWDDLSREWFMPIRNQVPER
jgi:putative endonuclease